MFTEWVYWVPAFTQPRVCFFPFAKALVVSGDAGVELSLGCLHGGQLIAIQGGLRFKV